MTLCVIPIDVGPAGRVAGDGMPTTSRGTSLQLRAMAVLVAVDYIYGAALGGVLVLGMQRCNA